MRTAAILAAALACGACAGRHDYAARYDLDEVAYETSARDASPGFSALPDAGGTSAKPAQKIV